MTFFAWREFIGRKGGWPQRPEASRYALLQRSCSISSLDPTGRCRKRRLTRTTTCGPVLACKAEAIFTLAENEGSMAEMPFLDDLLQKTLARLETLRRGPESTYRVQFHAGFKFRDATALVPYL